MVLLGPPFLFACPAILDAYLAVAMTELSIIQYYLRDFLCDPLLLVLNDVLILGPRNLSFLKLESFVSRGWSTYPPTLLDTMSYVPNSDLAFLRRYAQLSMISHKINFIEVIIHVRRQG